MPTTGNIIGFVIGLGIGGLLGAWLLQIAVKFLAKTKIGFGRAFALSFISVFVSFVVGFVVGFILGFLHFSLNGTTLALEMIVSFFIQTAIYSQFIKLPSGEQLNFRLACLISLMQLVLAVLILGIVGLLCYGVYVFFLQ